MNFWSYSFFHIIIYFGYFYIRNFCFFIHYYPSTCLHFISFILGVSCFNLNLSVLQIICYKWEPHPLHKEVYFRWLFISIKTTIFLIRYNGRSLFQQSQRRSKMVNAELPSCFHIVHQWEVRERFSWGPPPMEKGSLWWAPHTPSRKTAHSRQRFSVCPRNRGGQGRGFRYQNRLWTSRSDKKKPILWRIFFGSNYYLRHYFPKKLIISKPSKPWKSNYLWEKISK